MAAALSGVITVTTAGTAVNAPATLLGLQFNLRAHPSNTGLTFIGNDGSGDVTDANGYAMSPGQDVTVSRSVFASLKFDAATNGNKVVWVRTM